MDGINICIFKNTETWEPYAEYAWRPLPSLTITPGVKYMSIKRQINAPINQTTDLLRSISQRRTPRRCRSPRELPARVRLVGLMPNTPLASSRGLSLSSKKNRPQNKRQPKRQRTIRSAPSIKRTVLTRIFDAYWIDY